MIGGIIIISFFQSSDITKVTSEVVSRGGAKGLILTAYDSRDGVDLSGITSLDNNFDSQLCTDSCRSASNKIPTNGGTEFIVLTVRNVGPQSIHLDNLLVNEIVHEWDGNTGGNVLDASSDSSTGDYPLDGKFSIIPYHNDVSLEQRSATNIEPAEEVRLVIKLSGNISPDIKLNKPIRIIVDTGGFEPAKMILVGGNVR